VLIDGTPANLPGGDFDFSNLTLDNVDKVEIVHGAESALYGTDAMSGVVQIVSHRGTTRVPEINLFAKVAAFHLRAGARKSAAFSVASTIPLGLLLSYRWSRGQRRRPQPRLRWKSRLQLLGLESSAP